MIDHIIFGSFLNDLAILEFEHAHEINMQMFLGNRYAKPGISLQVAFERQVDCNPVIFGDHEFIFHFEFTKWVHIGTFNGDKRLRSLQFPTDLRNVHELRMTQSCGFIVFA